MARKGHRGDETGGCTLGLVPKEVKVRLGQWCSQKRWSEVVTSKVSDRQTKAEQRAEEEALATARAKALAERAARKAESHVLALMTTVQQMDQIGSKASAVTAKTIVEELKFLRDDDEAYRDAMAKIMVDSIEQRGMRPSQVMEEGIAKDFADKLRAAANGRD